MLALLEIVLPVFILVSIGYAAALTKLINGQSVKVLSHYAQTFAIPCLLFLAVVNLDLSTVFNPHLLLSFYTGSVISFVLGIYFAKKIFNRDGGESVAVGFGALFSNSVLLGLPIMERAFGVDSMAPNYAIISIHAIVCYSLGVSVMELSRSDGKSLTQTAIAVTGSLAKNPLVIGLFFGFVVNLTSINLPSVVESAAQFLARSGLPVALFALGGVLAQYGIRTNLPESLSISALSLLVHPAITYVLCQCVFKLPIEMTRGAVVTAAMAPGVNTYVFANIYQRAVNSAATTVFVGTALSVFSVTFWLWLLGA